MRFFANFPKRRKAMQFMTATGIMVLAAACSADADMPETHIVEMQGLTFVPATVEAKVGDTVLWINTDVMPHTATAADGAWDSGMMEVDDEWSLLIEEAGEMNFICTYHPGMEGVITAE